MKLDKRLTIAGKSFPIVNDSLTLELSGHARGEYLVKTEDGDPDLSGLIEYQHGYSDEKLYSMFKGIAHIGQAAGENQFRIIVKSLSSVLDIPGRFSLRHLTALDLMKKVSELTGLKFVCPTGAGYMNKRIPNFYNMDTCRGAIECFAAFGIERGIWSQLPDGKIFWGSWDDSPFAIKDPVPIDSKLITRQNPADRSFQIPVMPALGPGMRIRDNLMIEQLEIFGNNMRVRWLKFSET